MIANLLGWRGIGSVGIGVGCGAAEFLWKSVVQKVCMVVGGLEHQQILDPAEGPEVLPFENLDREFVFTVIIAPIVEEVVFRGVLQPALSYGIGRLSPKLKNKEQRSGISYASLISITTVAIGFGLIHVPQCKKGGIWLGIMATMAGMVFGVIREKFGLIPSIAAHMTSNLGTGLLDKYWPEFLEFSREREYRLMSDTDRRLRLLEEAVERADEAIRQMPDGKEERAELQALRDGLQNQKEALETGLGKLSTTPLELNQGFAP